MHLIFQPITIYTGQQIAQVIAHGLINQEPRIRVENVHCIGHPDTNEYSISIKAAIPMVRNTRVGFGGAVSVNGITINSVENESIF